MLLVVAGVLIFLWIVGLVGQTAGGIVNVLLVAALLVIIYDFVSGHRAV